MEKITKYIYKAPKYISLTLAWIIVIYFCLWVIGIIFLFLTGEIKNLP